MKTWTDTLTVAANGGLQTIHGQLIGSDGRPAPGGRMYAIGHLPQGQTQAWLADQLTDASGAASVSFRLPALPHGFRVDADVYMSLEGKSYSSVVSFTAR